MERRAPLVFLVFASFLYRWPALANAGTVNSDAAIVGIQAMHILRGQWQPLLLGSGYQTSVDSTVAALLFAFSGATPLALMLSTLLGHVAATLLAWSTLARHLRPWQATVAVLPLVFTPSPLHTYILGPPRQASLTLVFLAVWALDRAAASRAPSRAFAVGGALAGFACAADPYATLFLLPLLGLGALAAWGDEPLPAAARGEERKAARGEERKAARRESRAAAPSRSARLGSLFAGAAAGLVPFIWLLTRPQSVHGELTLTTAALARSLTLLTRSALPWLLSTTPFVPSPDGYVPWHAPAAFRLVELAGAALFLVGILYGAAALALRDVAWPLRRLGVFGASLLPLSLLGFLFSPMVMDLFSTRYLAAIVLMAPFALAPAAARLSLRAFGALAAPYLASAAVAGWLGFGDLVRGFAYVKLPAAGAADELRLARMLESAGVTHAMADYWVAYRLSFLTGEGVQTVPIHAEEDRYPPYRAAFARADTVAYVFDSARSRETWDPDRAASYVGGGTVAEVVHVGSLRAILFRRAPSSS